MRKHFLVALMLFAVGTAFSQQQVRKLPSVINHPSLNLYAPYISSDGNALLFISDNGQDGAFIISYTTREADWSAPAELPKHLNNRLNFMRGYALSADGKKLFVTSAQSPVIGGYDLFSADLKGTTWTNPENLMLPINSRTNEASPSITPDGNTLYFMRCDKMDAMNADGCKIFKASKKPNGQWGDPEELPSHINTGNSQTPRIMADQETLIFASDKMSGKGGMDLYMTRLQNGEWSEPLPMDFVNTEKDDQYVSVAALGRYVLRESKGSRGNYELTEFLIPQSFRPRGLMKVEGKITDENNSITPAYISITDLSNMRRIYNGRPAKDGTFSVYLPEGSRYEFSVDAEQRHIGYYTRIFDLRGEKIAQRERVNVVLKEAASGDEFLLAGVSFKPGSSDLESTSFDELKKLARLMKANSDLTFEIQVMLKGYREDSSASDPDLTETISESTPALVDSASTTTAADSTAHSQTIYHNDRTQRQAQSIVHYLTQQGVNESQVRIFVNAIPSEEEERELTVRAKVIN